MEKVILIAYENRHHPVEIDVSERSNSDIEKIKEALRRVGRRFEIKRIKEGKVRSDR